MARKKWSRRQQQAYFAARLSEEAGRRRSNLAPRITRNDPNLDKMMDFLTSGKKSNNPSVQRIIEKLKGIKEQPKRAATFNPGAGDFKRTKVPGQTETRLTRGRMVSRVYEIMAQPGEMQPEFKNDWIPSDQEKAKLISRARGFFERREHRTVGRKINRIAEKRTKVKLSALDEALAKQSALLGSKQNVPLSKQDEELLKATLKKFDAKAVEDTYDITPIEKLYGSRGYHVVPRLSIVNQAGKDKYEVTQRVVYPTKSLGQFRKEGALSFPNFKKTPAGEYIPKFQVGKIEGPERLGPKAPAKMPVLRVQRIVSGPQPLHKKATVESDINNNDPKKFQTRTIPNWRSRSPFQEVSGRNIAHPNHWDAVISARKEGGAFIVDGSTGQAITPPKFKKLEEKRLTSRFGDWKPNDIFELVKWNSEHTTDAEREHIFNKHIKDIEENPLRKKLREAEYQTAVLRDRQIIDKYPASRMADRIARVSEAAKTLRVLSSDVRQEARRKFVLEKVSKIKKLQREKEKSKERYNILEQRAREKKAEYKRTTPLWKRIVKRIAS